MGSEPEQEHEQEHEQEQLRDWQRPCPECKGGGIVWRDVLQGGLVAWEGRRCPLCRGTGIADVN